MNKHCYGKEKELSFLFLNKHNICEYAVGFSGGSKSLIYLMEFVLDRSELWGRVGMANCT